LMPKGLIALIAISVAVFLACCSVSTALLGLFKCDVYELLRPVSSASKEMVEGMFGFVDKITASAFAFLALALVISLFFLYIEATWVRYR